MELVLLLLELVTVCVCCRVHRSMSLCVCVMYANGGHWASYTFTLSFIPWRIKSPDEPVSCLFC